ncbi:Regucalcin [Atta colombica]|uniref:Regucalcin n=1 Tax=Atta colombica TaxID=520822 RepID=A0A195BB46_9HYME|nr:Regucalcin [Atta colombica]
MNLTIEKITDIYGFSKGLHWDNCTQKLYFVNFYDQYIHSLDPTGVVNSTMSNKVAMNDMKMAVIPKQGSLYRINDDLKFEKKISSVTITNKKIVFDLSETNLKGLPVGMTIDTNGNIWIALFAGSQVIGVRPRTGTVLCKVELPVENVISTTIKNTTLDKNLDSQAGAVFAIKGLEVRGVPDNMFKLVEALKNKNYKGC